MSERVSRLFEAVRPKTSVNQVAGQELSSQLRRVSRVNLSELLGSQLRPVGVRSVSAESQVRVLKISETIQKRPRLFACVQVGLDGRSPRHVLQSMVPKMKRTTAASVFERMRERFSRLPSASQRSLSLFASNTKYPLRSSVSVNSASVASASVTSTDFPVASRCH